MSLNLPCEKIWNLSFLVNFQVVLEELGYEVLHSSIYRLQGTCDQGILAN